MRKVVGIICAIALLVCSTMLVHQPLHSQGTSYAIVPGAISLQNDGTTGTTQYTLTISTTANPSTAIIASTGTTSGVLGVASVGAGKSGPVVILYGMNYQLLADGAITSGDYIGISSTTAGYGHDVGSSCPASGQVVGKWQATNASPGSVAQNAIIEPGFCTASSGSGLNAPSGTGPMKYTGSNNTAQSTAHDQAGIATCSAGSASGTAYTCTTSPSFTPAAGDLILFKADVANTGSATLNVDTSSVQTIKKQGGGTNLVANDLLASQWTLLMNDGTNWQMQGLVGNAAGGAPTAGTGITVSGTAVSVNYTDQTFLGFRDDFLTMNLVPGSGVCTGQAAYACGTAGSATLHGVAPSTNHPGVVECSSSGTNPSSCQFLTNADIQAATLNSIPNLSGVSGWSATFVFNVQQVSSNQVFVTGLMNGNSATPSDLIGIRFDQPNSTDTNFMMTCIKSGASTSATSASVAPATGYHTVTISPGTNANTIKFIFDGTTHDNLCGSTSIPTNNLALGWQYKNQDTTSAKLADIDLWSLQIPLTR